MKGPAADAVAVVGAGFTGLSAALHLAEAGSGSSLVARHRIDCEQTHRGLLFAAHSAKAEPGLERRAGF